MRTSKERVSALESEHKASAFPVVPQGKGNLRKVEAPGMKDIVGNTAGAVEIPEARSGSVRDTDKAGQDVDQGP